MSEQYLSVGQVNNYIKNIFEAEGMLHNICIYGEVSSYKISNNIAYFNLTDETGLLSCVLFNANKFDVPQIGDVVLVVGTVSYYAKGGKLSFNAYQIAPYGKGVLYEKFLKLKAELEGKGYFDISRKKPLPERVTKIGVVTSATGAVIQDIINVTTRRNPTVNIVLYPVKVQGVGAETEIVKGIEFFNNYDVDVVIVARGGGSIEDLQPFNTEVVATATYNSTKPIVSAVGHETDFTIIDFVADLRAPTPSAAAECVVNLLADDFMLIESYVNTMYDAVSSKINNYYIECENSANKMCYTVSGVLTKIESTAKSYMDKFGYLISSKIDGCEHKLEILKSKIESLNPMNILNKGYAKIEKDGRTIKSSKHMKSGNKYDIVFADGKTEVVGV